MENSHEITLGGQIAMALVQMLVLMVNGFLYARQKSAIDVEKRDRGAFGVDVEYTKHLAIELRDTVMAIKTKSYDELKAICEDLLRENAKLRAQVMSHEESIKTLNNKLASRQRTETRRAKESEPDPDDAPEDNGQKPSMEELARRGIAVPLFATAPQTPPPQAPPARTFGRAAKG